MSSADDEDPSHNVGRRGFLKNVAGTAGVAGVMASMPISRQLADEPSNSNTGKPTISLTINGQQREVAIDPRTTLVDLLREELLLTGTKNGCDHGACGSCTVHVNNQRVLACLTLAVTLQDSEVKTIEGVGTDQELHPLQQSFLRCDAYQCGYCTPGQIMSGLSCIDEGHATGSKEEVREWMSGNLCRCGAYQNIVAAVRQTAGADKGIDPCLFDAERGLLNSDTKANQNQGESQ